MLCHNGCQHQNPVTAAFHLLHAVLLSPSRWETSLRRLPVFWAPGSLSLLCSSPSTPCFLSCTLPRLPPAVCDARQKLLPHYENDRGLFCFAPHPGAGYRQLLNQTCRHLLPTARAASGDGAEAMHVSEHPGNDSNSSLSTKTSAQSHLHTGLQWLLTDLSSSLPFFS